MMRSMYSAVSALRVHQTRMDAIGNNIANVNTPGYKASRVIFSEAFSQTLSGASASSESGRGGSNPQQIGLGTNLAAITTYHTQGATQRTDNQTDIMIEGGGYFVLSPNSEGEERYYSRAGNFIVDEKGYMVAPNGFKLLDETFKPVRIEQFKTKGAKASEGVVLKGNIGFNEKVDPGTNIAYTSTVDTYDKIGNTHTLKFDIGTKLTTPPGANPAYSYRMVSIKDPNDAEKDELKSNRVGTLTPPQKGTTTGTTSIYRTFDASGNATDGDPLFMQFDDDGNYKGLVWGLTIDAKGFVDPSGAGKYVTQTTNGQALPAPPAGYTGSTLKTTLGDPGTMTYTINTAGTEPIELKLQSGSDKKKWVFNNLTHLKMGTNIKNTADGRSAGMIKKFTIASNGDVKGSYTNGQEEVLARIGLASFDNPSGLLKEGGNLFSATSNSGNPNYGRPSSGNLGRLTPGAYEMSNVDLSAEFTDMITTQRGFQANSRVVTTSDEILQELVNLKR